MNVFKPRQFGETTSLFSLATMSMSYWDLGEEFRTKAIQDIESGKSAFYSVYVFPAIIMYCSAVEALINESLALLEEQTKDQPLIDDIRSVRKGLNSYRDILSKIRRAHELLSQIHHSAIQEESLQNYQALAELRNAIIHYSPDYVDVHHWPQKLKQALERSKVRPVLGDWTITFRTKEVLLWSNETSRTLISAFLQVTKADESRFFNES